jgi:hypothetical protein
MRTPICRLRVNVLLAAALGASAAACGAPFEMSTPPGMVALDESEWSVYDFRATTPEGVVVATRAIRQGEGRETPAGDLDFWSEAIGLRMRTSAGYALLGEEPFVSADGTEGVRLRFGRDQNTTPYRYDVVLLVTDRWIHVVEAGGRADQIDEVNEVVESALASYVVRR